MWCDKRANLVSKNTIELILAVAAIVFLVLVLFKVLSPSYNQADETAKSYLELLKREIALADSSEEGKFSLWMPSTSEGVLYYLVYFGQKVSIVDNDWGNFVYHETPMENNICVCYKFEENSFCGECFGLEHRAVYGLKEGSWVVSMGQDLKINLSEGVYLFEDDE